MLAPTNAPTSSPSAIVSQRHAEPGTYSKGGSIGVVIVLVLAVVYGIFLTVTKLRKSAPKTGGATPGSAPAEKTAMPDVIMGPLDDPNAFEPDVVEDKDTFFVMRAGEADDIESSA